MKLTSKKVFFIMTAGFVLLSLLSVGAVFFGNQLLTQKNDRLTELKLENRVLEEQKISLIQAKRAVEEYSELEDIAKQIVPQDKDQARTVRELVNIANASGISISSVGFPNSSLGQAATPAPSGGDAPAAAAPSASPPSQVEAVPDIPGVFQMTVSLGTATSVEFSRLIAFLERLESNRRTAQVTELNITPTADNRSLLEFALTLNVYIKP